MTKAETLGLSWLFVPILQYKYGRQNGLTSSWLKKTVLYIAQVTVQYAMKPLNMIINTTNSLTDWHSKLLLQNASIYYFVNSIIYYSMYTGIVLVTVFSLFFCNNTLNKDA